MVNTNLDACAKEGSCNFTTIGGIFQLLGVAEYVRPGTYVLSGATTADNLTCDLEKFFDQAVEELHREQESGIESRNVLDEVMDSLNEEGTASFKATIEELGKIFGLKKATEE